MQKTGRRPRYPEGGASRKKLRLCWILKHRVYCPGAIISKIWYRFHLCCKQNRYPYRIAETRKILHFVCNLYKPITRYLSPLT